MAGLTMPMARPGATLRSDLDVMRMPCCRLRSHGELPTNPGISGAKGRDQRPGLDGMLKAQRAAMYWPQSDGHCVCPALSIPVKMDCRNIQREGGSRRSWALVKAQSAWIPMRTIDATSDDAFMNGERMRWPIVLEIRVSCSTR